MTEQANQVDYEQNNNYQLLNILRRQSRSLSLITSIIILITLVCAWLFFRVDQLGKQLDSVTSDLVVVTAELIDMRSELSHIGSLARNANNYAHSHGYSDALLKTDIHDIDQSLEKVLQLQGVYYYWNEEAISKLGLGSEQQIGVIAQDVEKVFPELVTVDEHGYKQVDYERLTAVLIEAIKEQQKEIDLLKER